jgi:phosphopentomutase
MKRIFLTVLDSFGVGYLPDADKFGDLGANTLKSVSKSEHLNIPNLIKCGLGNIDGVDAIPKCDTPIGIYGRLREKSMGKDTTVGHWEIGGVVSDSPLPTYPDGFPNEVLEEFTALTGYGVLCNKPYSGTQVINDYGKEHLETGKLIIYTSADSVFQIAAHEELVPIEKLYSVCEIARKMLVGKHGVGRVIARPFVGEYPNFKRTANRRDFSLEPTGKTVLDALYENKFDVISIGKIYDIFAHRGISEYHLTHSNTEGISKMLEIMERDFNGLCFTNLVDFDMLYGHRNDVNGYAAALSEFDLCIPEIMKRLNDDDIYIITADHGCDPGDVSTDHTREYVPIIILGKNIQSKNAGTIDYFSTIAKTIGDLMGIGYDCSGTSLANLIK